MPIDGGKDFYQVNTSVVLLARHKYERRNDRDELAFHSAAFKRSPSLSTTADLALKWVLRRTPAFALD